ncbi:hypothetical protein PACTADRAFT_75476 [Pachysolen tannophilus NRRL Y-2460]|uniref:Uncharacterized protein n=1 Tax=Pachysolen tannophilus NRRL Y-2460 TaxID=669874 RepID=A0A1E4TX69_PACTA|nr:hypothetical protein PACTADRAFT_75476 [Pachysolen tannophilus NRRL Y-2460]
MKLSIISGGTASNELVPVFNRITPNLAYIIPISDNGGSTAELIRILSGPAVGDIRSRLTRLIPTDDKESLSLKNLMLHRLSNDPVEAKREWLEIVEGTSLLWHSIEPSCKEIIRSFLIHVHMELLKRSRQSSKNFKYELASIGNMFLTGARLFCGSLDSAIELFSRITRIPKENKVLPCLNTNFTYHISAILADGSIVTGQSQISHPTKNNNYSGNGNNNNNNDDDDDDDDAVIDEHEYATPLYIHPDLKHSNLHFSKDVNIPLPSPIERIFYISPYGEEIFPIAQNRVLKSLIESDIIIYSIGSLMTSTVPVLILQGVGQAILKDLAKDGKHKKKILLLNGSHDRETYGLNATGFIKTIISSIEYSMKLERNKTQNNSTFEEKIWSKYITHLIYLDETGDIKVDVSEIESHGIKCVAVKNFEKNKYDLDDLEIKLKEIID